MRRDAEQPLGARIQKGETMVEIMRDHGIAGSREKGGVRQ
jgi:hypothetical protein